MARLKKGEKRKTQMTIRVDPEIAERLKSIDKYSAKVGAFISKGIDDYEKFLEINSIEAAIKESNIPFYDLTECSCTSEILNPNNDFLDIFKDDKFRHDYIKSLKKLNEYYDNEIFFKFHPELYDLQKSNNDRLLNLLENWNETKLLLNKKLNDMKKIENSK